MMRHVITMKAPFFLFLAHQVLRYNVYMFICCEIKPMHFRGALFDLDGTLVNSLDFVERSWSDWAQKKGFSAQEVRHYLHGKTAMNTLRHFLGDASESILEAEFRRLEEYEADNVAGMTSVVGSVAFLNQLNTLGVPWGIVTSGSFKVASARIRQAGFPPPAVLVTSEDIQTGKPHPEPFLLGAKRLGLPAAQCLAFEDSVAGLTSAREAGCLVVEMRTAQSEIHDIAPLHRLNHYLHLNVSRNDASGFSLIL
jgi:sugar-phosphatase